MTLLRSLLYIIGQSVSIAIYLPVTLFSRLLSPPAGLKLASGWARFNIWWLRITCGLSHSVTGLENLPESPCVILSKHQSAWETIAFQTFMPSMCFVVKRELLWIPFFGWGLAASHPIAINRSEARKALEQVLNEGKQRLESGLYVCIFPEGTRTAPGDSGRYNPGGAMLAAKAGVDVVPVAHNAGCFWGRNGLRKRSGCVQVEIGPVISTEGRKVREINALAESWIEEKTEVLIRDASPDVITQSGVQST